MIRLPQRSVTRFFIPMIDVLTLLFCIYLLMPIVDNADDGESEGDDPDVFEVFEEEAEVEDGKVRAAWGEGDGGSGPEIERPKITFADVGGMEALKEEMEGR